MAVLNNKIDFVAVITVTMANPNGDPLNGNRPRTAYADFGEISDVCIKRKMRNRMQDMGQKIFVQSDDRRDDDYDTLAKRAEANGFKSTKDKQSFYKNACETWLDVRTFGQVFAFKSNSKKSSSKGDDGCVSVGVRGPVSIHQAISASPVEVVPMQITKSVSGDKKENGERGSDTMGMKHFVKFGVYVVKGSINVQLAEKTGFSEEDADLVKECLRTMFVNDASSARPDGSMEVVKLFWFRHNCKEGQYSAAKVHRSVHVTLKEGVAIPASVDDYVITADELPGLVPEEIDGV